MNGSAATPRLTTPARWLAVLCLIFSSLTSVSAIQEAITLSSQSEAALQEALTAQSRALQAQAQKALADAKDAKAAQTEPLPPAAAELQQAILGLSEALADPRISQAVQEAQLSALRPMRNWRIGLLMALTLTSSLCFVSTLRFLRPLGIPREAARRLLSRTAFLTAVLRTLTGAQDAAMAKKLSATLETLFRQHSAPLVELSGYLRPALLGQAVAFTVLLVGAFVIFFQYFGNRERMLEA